VSTQPLCFFTVDSGTATTSVAVLGPVAGRYRLLGAAAAPRGVAVDVLLEDLAWRVSATDPDLLPPPSSWRDWARLDVAARPAVRVVSVAPTDRGAAALEGVAVVAGWVVRGRIAGARHDPLAATELCLEPDVDAILVATGDTWAEERLTPLLDAVARRRPDLSWLLCGPGELPGVSITDGAAIRLPGLTVGPPGLGSQLLDALRGTRPPRSPDPAATAAEPLPDPRDGLRAAVATLAGLLDRRIESVDVGASGGARVVADQGAVAASIVVAEAALLPETALDDDRVLEGILRWSALRVDPYSLADRARNVGIAPWRDAGGDGARLRLAALRAALGRLDARWRAATTADGRAAPPAADLLVCSGGAFSAVPPAAAALAIADGLRRPGASTLFHDHARILAPIGSLPDEGDRRRLLADLLDDALLPLGSVIVAGEVRPGPRFASTLRVTSVLQQQEIDLTPGALRLVDLPPGVPARIELETREGSLLGVRARKLALDVTGGLAGLLVDTREVPLRLPDRPERRRALLEAWERPVWGQAEA
jgi:hypothetical protein